VRDEAGLLPNRSFGETWSGSVYYPWERWLMSRRRCKAVFPRDKLTTETLQKWSIPAFDLGNPMMDGIAPEHPAPVFYETNAELKEMQRSLVVTLLPGSRVPEAYDNWQQIVQATDGFLDTFTERTLLFLGAIAPAVSLDLLGKTLQGYGWHQQSLAAMTLNLQFQDENAIAFTKKNATLILTQNDYNLCLLKGDCAIAMAGTATEQFVGLGKPAIAMPGKGPQYNPIFAEAQTRLLGPSLILVEQPQKVASTVQQLLRDPDWLQLIADNGFQRMGQPGAACRIANCLMERFEGLKATD
jgi:uncharacterized protein (TIGR03492 family)